MGFVLLQGLEFGRQERGEALPEYVSGDVSQDNEGLTDIPARIARELGSHFAVDKLRQ